MTKQYVRQRAHQLTTIFKTSSNSIIVHDHT